MRKGLNKLRSSTGSKPAVRTVKHIDYRDHPGGAIPITRRIGDAYRYPNYKFRLGPISYSRCILRSWLEASRSRTMHMRQ